MPHHPTWELALAEGHRTGSYQHGRAMSGCTWCIGAGRIRVWRFCQSVAVGLSTPAGGRVVALLEGRCGARCLPPAQHSGYHACRMAGASVVEERCNDVVFAPRRLPEPQHGHVRCEELAVPLGMLLHPPDGKEFRTTAVLAKVGLQLGHILTQANAKIVPEDTHYELTWRGAGRINAVCRREHMQAG